MTDTSEKKARRKITLADRLAEYDARIAQSAQKLEQLKEERAVLVDEAKAQAAALLAQAK